MTLEPLFQTVLVLSYILLLASPTCDAVDQVVAVACHVVLNAVCLARHGGYYVGIRVEQWAIPALTVSAFLVDSHSPFPVLRDGGGGEPGPY